MFLLPFTTTYLCESGFSSVTITKSKSRNSLKTATLNATMRVSLSPINPRLDLIISQKQGQVSHYRTKLLVSFMFVFVTCFVGRIIPHLYLTSSLLCAYSPPSFIRCCTVGFHLFLLPIKTSNFTEQGHSHYFKL